MITSCNKENNARLWDVNIGIFVACVPVEPDEWSCVQVLLSRSASVFAVEGWNKVHLYDWSGAALRSVAVRGVVQDIQFTPCGKYLVAGVVITEFINGVDTDDMAFNSYLRQYDVSTMSCVHVMPQSSVESFVISPCSRVVVTIPLEGILVTRHLYPHNSE